MSWENLQLGEFLTLKRGYDLPSAQRKEGAIPIVSSSGITGRHSTAKVDGPGVVTGRYGTLGEVFFVDEDYWPLNTALYVQDFKGNNKSMIGSSGRQRVQTSCFDDFAVRLPSRFLRYLFDEAAAVLFRQVGVLTVQTQRLVNARDLLLPRMMKGEVTV